MLFYSLNLFLCSLYFFFFCSTFFFVSWYSSITLTAVIKSNLFSPKFPRSFFNSLNFLFNCIKSSSRCSSCPSSHDNKNCFPLNLMLTFAICQFPPTEYLFLDLIHLFFQKIQFVFFLLTFDYFLFLLFFLTIAHNLLLKFYTYPQFLFFQFLIDFFYFFIFFFFFFILGFLNFNF